MSHALSSNWTVRPAAAAFLGPHCHLLGPSPQERCQQRVAQLRQLGLLAGGNSPGFDEVTEQVTAFLQVPICVVTVADETVEYIRAASGLSHLGAGNPLARLRQVPLAEGLGTYVVESGHPFFVADTGENPVIAASQLVYTYGVGAYGAVPLVAPTGQCIGTVAIMAGQARPFTPQELGYLEMASRWAMGDYERRLCQSRSPPLSVAMGLDARPVRSSYLQALIDAVRLHLMGQLVQHLRSPLTAVLGMTSILGQEIYGPLTYKQREYIDIIHHSSKALMEQVEDMVELGLWEPEQSALTFTQVDIEMLGQQVVNPLVQLAAQRCQSLAVSIEPGERLWTIDK